MFRTYWDMFKTFSKPLGPNNWFSMARFFDKTSDFVVFKAFVSIFLYYTLYQGKLKVITRPQCGLHFFIRSLVFALAAYKVLSNMFHFQKPLEQKLGIVWKNQKWRPHCGRIITLSFPW